MLYCDEYDKDCDDITVEECDNGCCDTCMFCVVYPDDIQADRKQGTRRKVKNEKDSQFL